MNRIVEKNFQKVPLKLHCMGCSYEEVVNYKMLKNQKIKDVTWTCPKCGDRKRTTLTILE